MTVSLCWRGAVDGIAGGNELRGNRGFEDRLEHLIRPPAALVGLDRPGDEKPDQGLRDGRVHVVVHIWSPTP